VHVLVLSFLLQGNLQRLRPVKVSEFLMDRAKLAFVKLVRSRVLSCISRSLFLV